MTVIPVPLMSGGLQGSSLFMCDLISWERFASTFTGSGMEYINLSVQFFRMFTIRPPNITSYMPHSLQLIDIWF